MSATASTTTRDAERGECVQWHGRSREYADRNGKICDGSAAQRPATTREQR
ncbi:hypothetical protein [Micromonospora aurantiaca (nom. illeg.)]|uniref:hypothetical protein n=1 Tax=Micromonospora aurantiaca (nom. illeg.) TaxID=47850 RepID=UPI0033FC05E5